MTSLEVLLFIVFASLAIALNIGRRRRRSSALAKDRMAARYQVKGEDAPK
jgi:hypothetical protein